MGGADNTGVTEELVFGFGVALVGDDLAKDEVGGVALWVELAEGFVELGGVGGAGIVLGGRRGEVIEVCGEPGGAGRGESLIDGEFIKGEVGEGGLVVDGAGVEAAGEFHDGVAEVGVAGEDGGLNRGGAAVGGQERGVEVQDAGGFKKLEQVGLDEGTKGGEDAEGGGILAFEVGDGGEVGGGAGVEDDFYARGGGKGGEGGVGEGAVAEKDDLVGGRDGARLSGLGGASLHRERGRG